jgi:GntR family transcriptional regulator, histidine utilization repressor
MKSAHRAPITGAVPDGRRHGRANAFAAPQWSVGAVASERGRPAAPYALVKQALKAELGGGRWPSGARMPSDAELVARFAVSRMTVTRALRELQGEGLVERLQGVGTFAAQAGGAITRLAIPDLPDEIGARGRRHQVVVDRCECIATPPALAPQIGLAPGTPVFHSVIVQLEDGLAVQCEDRYVNPACAPDYLQVDFTRGAPAAYLAQAAPARHTQTAIEAGLATRHEAGLLGIARRAPCLVVVRRTLGLEGPIALARQVHPGTRYRIAAESP